MTKRKVWIGLIIYAVVCMAAFVTMLILIFR
nr:MAG TPA: Thioredoxin signature protein-LIKE DOMAIN, ALPHA-BETA PROTEIN, OXIDOREDUCTASE.62A [Caudoviricetes sp.]